MASFKAQEYGDDTKDKTIDVDTHSVATSSSYAGDMPIRFTVFGNPNLKKCSVQIGQDKDHPEKFVKTGPCFTVHDKMVLHRGPDADSPVLASSVNRYWLGKNIVVSLAATDDSKALETTMHGHWRLNKTHFDFEVPDGKFEWRSSRGEDVKDLGARYGWKLVHLDGTDSDSACGGEVVAVWSTNYNHLKLAGDFSFVGKGASGEFSDQWANMAVITAMTIGKMMREATLMASTA